MKKKQNGKKILILLACVYVVYILVSQQIRIYNLNKEQKANAEKIAQQERETKELMRAKEMYQSDEFIEKMAREKLGYVKPGEKQYIDVSQQQ